MRIVLKRIDKNSWLVRYEDGSEERIDDFMHLLGIISDADVVEGDTYPLREELKLRSFYWDPEKRVWRKSYSRAVAAERKELRELIEYMHRKRVYETFDEFWEAECEGEYRFITKEEARQIWWEITHKTWDE